MLNHITRNECSISCPLAQYIILNDITHLITFKHVNAHVNETIVGQCTILFCIMQPDVGIFCNILNIML